MQKWFSSTLKKNIIIIINFSQRQGSHKARPADVLRSHKARPADMLPSSTNTHIATQSKAINTTHKQWTEINYKAENNTNIQVHTQKLQ